MTPVVPGSDMRKMFTKVPFGLDFKIYLFNVTNPMDVQKGSKPKLVEVGPFCYSEWKEKIDISDSPKEDTMTYKPVDTFFKENWPGCLTGEEELTILHPLMVGMVNTVSRTKPAMLSLVSKAVTAIYRKPTSVYLTAKANDILFDGVIIDCDVSEFAAKAVCSQLHQAPDLRHVSETELAFSLLGPKNATPGKPFKIYRGQKKSRNLGLIIEYDGKKQMDVWSTKECNKFGGTDGTIFPPFLKKEEGLESFSSDLCRSLVAKYEDAMKYDGIPVWRYTASLGDMSKNADEKCFCPTNQTCLKKGMMDLFKCIGVPIYVSLPHFYDCDESYLGEVDGLHPSMEHHSIQIYFEHMTGGPVWARKRLQFNMPLEPNSKIGIFKELPTVVHPIFWVEEGVSLNDTFTKPIKSLFTILKVVKITKWIIFSASLIGIAVAAYMMYENASSLKMNSVHKVQPTDGKTPTNQFGENGKSEPDSESSK
ncbi:sensory neuron membrane protein 1-like isoform X2 [Coccinella septempunctata]|nr:sensory neuron membrane protein 1-like isoform X2 [Coccinella septempunctata]